LVCGALGIAESVRVAISREMIAAAGGQHATDAEGFVITLDPMLTLGSFSRRIKRRFHPQSKCFGSSLSDIRNHRQRS
jgi:hypothetical protein